ncbi:MAG: hypothetical protein QOK17_2191 [Sphingomonadales bacterium]|nr:hypothetical protein [Sphingomonadales bacterium]
MGAAAAAASDRWWIIGSAATALHGVRGLTVGDVDLLMSRRDAAALLRSKGVEPAPGEPGGRFRSDVFGRWRAGAYVVEVMGGFHVEGIELVPETRIAAGGLYVPSVGELIAMCELFGRPKDKERTQLLRAL